MAEETDRDQKTEAPTQKRLEDARRKGDVAKSHDVAIWFVFVAAAAIMAGAEPLARGIASPLTSMIDHPHRFDLSQGGALRLARDLVAAVALPLLVVLGVFAFAALAGHLAQHRPLWTSEKIKPGLDKIDPIKGLGRLFGPEGWINFGLSILKIAAVSVALVYALWPDRAIIAAAGALEPSALLGAIQAVGGRLMLAAILAVGVLAALDYVLKRQSFMARMRMSRQEIRDEFKETEGDPHIKARLRQIRLERSRKRMLAAVPTATVVVTNPTHYSIALKYDPKVDAAPVCVAKGVDELAMRIRQVATEAGVPLVENVPLARALYAGVDVDQTVPREHFEAVAKVISFVLSTAKGRRKP
jgi:flagellar biosynthesis protein FlhB